MNTDSTVTEHEHVKTSSWAKKKKYRNQSWTCKYSIMKTNSTVTEDEHVNTPSWAKKKKYRYRSWIYKYSIMNTHNTVTEHEHVNFTPLWTRTYCNWTWTCIHVSFFPSYVNTIYNINKITLWIKMYILLNREHGYIYMYVTVRRSLCYIFFKILSCLELFQILKHVI